jgi:hypothetical protein
MNVKEFTSRRASKLLAFGGSTGSMATALLVSQAAPEPRSWVGRVRVVGAADVIDALGAWRVSGSPDFHRDSIEAGSFGTRPRTFLRAATGRPMPALLAAGARSRSPRVRSPPAPWPRPPCGGAWQCWFGRTTDAGVAAGRVQAVILRARKFLTNERGRVLESGELCGSGDLATLVHPDLMPPEDQRLRPAPLIQG